MKLKIEFAFGIEYDKDSQPLDPGHVFCALEVLKRFASDIAGGCTIFRHTGAWINHGDLVQENGITLVIVMGVQESVVANAQHVIAEHIKTAFRQTAVLVTSSQVWSVLI